MVRQPKLSIIIPAYNSELYIHKCLDSILSQTFNDYEIILIDDGSTDRTRLICEEYVKKDIRIRAFFQSNKGVSKTRNIGMDLACGIWAFFIDSDDYLANRYVLDNLESKMEDNIDLIQFAYNTIEKDKICYSAKYQVAKYFNTRDEYLKNKLFSKTLWCYIFKRINFIKFNIRFNETISYAEDWSFITQYLHEIDHIYVSNHIVYNHVNNDTSLMSQVYTVDKLEQHMIVMEYFINLLEKSTDSKWNGFLQEQIKEIYHFYLYLFSKIRFTKSEKHAIIHTYRKKYKQYIHILGYNKKYVIAYLFPCLYIHLAKKKENRR